jgi:hypothetical protein
MSGAVKRCHPKNIGIVRLWKKKSWTHTMARPADTWSFHPRLTISITFKWKDTYIYIGYVYFIKVIMMIMIKWWFNEPRLIIRMIIKWLFIVIIISLWCLLMMITKWLLPTILYPFETTLGNIPHYVTTCNTQNYLFLRAQNWEHPLQLHVTSCSWLRPIWCVLETQTVRR